MSEAGPAHHSTLNHEMGGQGLRVLMPCSACSASPRRNARVSIRADQRFQTASRRTTYPSPTRVRQPPAHREVASTCSGHGAFRIAGDGFACSPSKLFFSE